MADAREGAAPRKASIALIALPFVLLAVAIAVWSGWWFYLQRQTQDWLTKTAADLNGRGYVAAWRAARVSGYPFRLDVTFTDLRLSEASGWAISMPTLKAETYAYELDHWVAFAPQGVTLTRPDGGPMRIGGRALRASLAGAKSGEPRLAVEGEALTFAAAPGARPFWLASVGRLDVALRPGPDDQAAALMRIDQGVARAAGVIGGLAGGKPVSLNWESSLTHRSAITGPDWPSAVRAWTEAGGALTLRAARLAAGDVSIEGAGAAPLTVGSDGSLRGSVNAKLRGGQAALAVFAGAGLIDPAAAHVAGEVIAARQGAAPDVALPLTFEAGRTTVGPVALAPAPRAF